MTREAFISFVMSVGPSVCISAAPTGRISVKFDIGRLVRKSVEDIRVWLISGTVD